MADSKARRNRTGASSEPESPSGHKVTLSPGLPTGPKIPIIPEEPAGPKPPTTPARILCLDGGGVRGIATLTMLQHIMDKVNETRSKDEQMKPCDCFDLICGTSTGGLIALMLGRLEFVRVRY